MDSGRCFNGFHFYPRPPRGGRRRVLHRRDRHGNISIHALREEGDRNLLDSSVHLCEFLSTPSARRATGKQACCYPVWTDFYPRPPRGGRLCHICKTSRLCWYFYPRPPRGGRQAGAAALFDGLKFLSTPSARRATCPVTLRPMYHSDFYPRPPRGGRLLRGRCIRGTCAFLSTPSARRATAKTERKYSAFVSLYTSLHKLQRGLCKASRKITPLLAQSTVIPVRSIPENHVHCLFALAGHQKISTLSCANSGCSPTWSTLV